MSTFAVGNRAIAICDRCGQRYKLKELKFLTINGNQVNTKVCPSCWEPDHPQNELGRYPVRDPQALRDPRSDAAERDDSREITVPGGGTVEDYIRNSFPI